MSLFACTIFFSIHGLFILSFFLSVPELHDSLVFIMDKSRRAALHLSFFLPEPYVGERFFPDLSLFFSLKSHSPKFSWWQCASPHPRHPILTKHSTIRLPELPFTRGSRASNPSRRSSSSRPESFRPIPFRRLLFLSIPVCFIPFRPVSFFVFRFSPSCPDKIFTSPFHIVTYVSILLLSFPPAFGLRTLAYACQPIIDVIHNIFPSQGGILIG